MTKHPATVALVLMSALTVGRISFAHEGPHKVMGTVSAVHEHRLEVRKAADGRKVSINVDGNTKIIHGRMKIKVSDIKLGDRVVVTATEKKGSDGKGTLRASEIRLGAAATPK